MKSFRSLFAKFSLRCVFCVPVALFLAFLSGFDFAFASGELGIEGDLMALERAQSSYEEVVANADSKYIDVCLSERYLAHMKFVNAHYLGLDSFEVERLKKKSLMDCGDEPVFVSKIVKLTADETQNQYVALAAEISGNDLDFILTLEQENGLWTADRTHGVNRNGTTDHGFCGLNSRYHWHFISSKDFLDPRKQLEYCYNIYKEKPYRFYGYFIRHRHKSKFGENE
jgi:hypothetical protein